MDATTRTDLAALTVQLRGYEVIAAEALACWLDTWALIDERLDQAREP